MTHVLTTGLVRIGTYAVEVDSSAESFAHFEPERDEDNARALAVALAEEPEDSALVATVEELHETAEAVTNQVERADELVRAATGGHILELDALSSEIDSLLGLLGRLDRADRFEEQLRLARALHGLLILSRRWLDLVRALRSTLRAAQIAGSQPGQAWALHELGSLHLCAGAPELAKEHLGEALRLEQSLGALTGRCATRHNHDCARRDTTLRAAAKGPLHRLMRLAGLVGILVILGAGATAIALAIGNQDNHSAGGLVSSTSRSIDTTTESSSADRIAPSVRLDAPADGTAITTSTPEFSGAAGTEPGDKARVFVVVLDDAGAPVPGSPFSTTADRGTWAYTPTAALADGSYSASAQQKDQAGNTGTSATNAFTIDTTESSSADRTAPSVRLDAPADGTAITTSTPEFSGAAGTEPGDKARVFVVVLDDAGAPVPGSPFSTTADRGTWAYTPTAALADGSYSASAQQKDQAGNTGTSATNAFTIDTAAPTLTLECPGTIASDPHVCTVTSSDAGTARIDVYEVLLDAPEQLLPDSPRVEVQADVPTRAAVDLPAGAEFRLVAVQTDTAGNEGKSNSQRVEAVG